MWKLSFLLTLVLIPFTSVHADMVVGFGIGTTTKYETKEESPGGRDLLDFGGGFGLGADFEFVLSRKISLNLSGVYRNEDALTQYQLNGIEAVNLDTTATTIAASVGPRFRFMELGRFRVLLGGGYTLGKLSVDYDRNDYVRTVGPENSLDKEESNGFNGYYYEAGVEFILTKENALRLIGRETSYKTGAYETMDNSKLTISQTQFFLQYLQYLNF